MSIDNPYIITYSNYLFFNGRTLAFRKKQLFDITGVPFLIPFLGHWNIGSKQLSVKLAESLIVKGTVKKDISDLQWYVQEQLNEVFNLQENG